MRLSAEAYLQDFKAHPPTLWANKASRKQRGINKSQLQIQACALCATHALCKQPTLIHSHTHTHTHIYRKCCNMLTLAMAPPWRIRNIWRFVCAVRECVCGTCYFAALPQCHHNFRLSGNMRKFPFIFHSHNYAQKAKQRATSASSIFICVTVCHRFWYANCAAALCCSLAAARFLLTHIHMHT